MTLGLASGCFYVDAGISCNVASAFSLTFLPSAYIVSGVPFGNSIIVMPVNLLARWMVPSGNIDSSSPVSGKTHLKVPSGKLISLVPSGKCFSV